MNRITTCPNCGGELKYISNSVARCTSCNTPFSAENGMIQEIDFESIYREATQYQTFAHENDDEHSYTLAMGLFKELGDYKDSAHRYEMCEESICAIQAERHVEQIKRGRMRIIRVFFASVLILAVGISGIVYHIQNNKYEAAVSFYMDGNYTEAISVFSKLGKYKDSEQYIKNIKDYYALCEENYMHGVKYYDAHRYSEAMEAFLKCNDYKDSGNYIEATANELYILAGNLYDNKEYEKAEKAIVSIPESAEIYSKALLLLSEVQAAREIYENELAEQKRLAEYETAIAYYTEGFYEVAQESFVNLGDYKASKEYLALIGNIFYQNAETSYKEKDYNEAGIWLHKIDSQEEWNFSDKAVSFLNQIKSEYKEEITVEARNICRKDGYNAMVAYLEGKVCSLLDRDESRAMIDECTIKTVYLNTLEPYSTGKYSLVNTTNGKDNLGNNYDYVLYGYMGNGYEQYNAYYIQKKYCYLTATVAISNGRTSHTGSIKIVGDDKVLWSDKNVTKETLPYQINVDISNVDVIKIYINGYFGGTSGDLDVVLCDAILSE